jgi:hypothetical protein
MQIMWSHKINDAMQWLEQLLAIGSTLGLSGPKRGHNWVALPLIRVKFGLSALKPKNHKTLKLVLFSGIRAFGYRRFSVEVLLGIRAFGYVSQ